MTSCDDSRQESTSAAAERASLVDGRSFDVLVPSSSSGMERLEVRIGDDGDGHYADLTERLSAACDGAVEARASSISTALADGRALGATADVAAHSLCMGHEWMNLAMAPTVTDFFGDGSFARRERADDEETRTEQLERLIGTRGLDLSLPVPSNRSAATFAYLALGAFREAALTGAEILELAPVNSLAAPVRAANPDGSGLSDDPSDTTPLADAVVYLTAEATHRMLEAATLAEGLTANQAQARLADRGADRAANVSASWLAAHDSRAEIAGMWMGRPDCSCCEISETTCPAQGIPIGFCHGGGWCAQDYQAPEIDECACCANPSTCAAPGICGPGALCDTDDDDPDEDPVDPDRGGGTCTPPASAEDDVAEDIVASIGVLPPLQATEAEILHELASAVRADDRSLPVDVPADELLTSRFGISAHAFVRAVRRSHERVRTLGLPLVRRAADTSGVARYTGMRAHPTPEQLAAYTASRTIGTNRFDYQEALTEEGAYRGSTSHIVPFAYGRQGVLPALDVVASALRHGLARPELEATDLVGGRPEPPGARRLALTAMTLARRMVPRRMKLRVGRANADGLDRAELTCYGCDGNPANYTLVVGESGMHCATTESIAGEPCDLDDYRVRVTPTVLTEAVHNGIADRHLVFTLNAASLPPGIAVAGRIPSVHFYLTELEGSTRRVVTTFTPIEGPNAGTYSRTTYIPVVDRGMVTATAQSVPSTEDCYVPRLCCDGLPCDPILPRESELVTDRLGENRYESIDEALYRTALDASSQADALGVEAIQQQLAADLAAHQARDELEALCGGVINVESTGPVQCEDDDDCANDAVCLTDLGMCEFTLESEVEALNGSEGPDTSSIEACLGGELVNVSFGSDPHCYFQAVDDAGAADPTPTLPPCTCTDAACPDVQCPVLTGDEACDATRFPGISGTNYVFLETQTLNTVESQEQFDPPDCRDLATLRADPDESDRLEAAARLLASDWLNLLAFSQLGERIGYTPDLFQVSRVTLDGANWYRTGSVHGGITEDAFPCAMHDVLAPDGVLIDFCSEPASDWTFGPPLLCGTNPPTGSCSGTEDRIGMNYRLYDAAALVAVLGGASGRYIYRPGYKAYNHAQGFELSNDRWTTSEDSASHYEQPFSDWFPLEMGDAYGMVSAIGDRVLFRACASSAVCATTDLPDYPGLINLPGPPLPTWHGVTNSGGDLLIGQIVTAMDDANQANEDDDDNPAGLGYNQPNISASVPPGDASLFEHQNQWSVPTYHPGAGPDYQYKVRCVRVDNASGPLGPAAFEFGALCPTLFAAIPADMGTMATLYSVERTTPQRLADFWSPAPGDDSYSLHDFLYDVARRELDDGGPEVGRWSTALTGLPELNHDGAAPYGRVLDALELACIAQYETGGGGCGLNVSEVPEIEGPEDFLALERSLDCAAATIEHGIQNAVLFDVPQEIVTDIEQGDISATYPGLRGEYGETTAALRSSAESIGMAADQMAAALRQLSSDVETARHQLEIQDLESEMVAIQAEAQMAGAIAECASKSFSGLSGIANAVTNPAELLDILPGVANDAAECASKMTMASAAVNAANIAEDINNHEADVILIGLQQSFGMRLDALASASNLLVQGYAEMQQAITQLDTIRNQASSAAMIVLGYPYDPETGRENNYLQAQRNWTSRWIDRYERAFDRARRAAWFARRGLEARIGMDLSDMHDHLALVEAPADWADTLCTMTPIDYDALRGIDEEVEQPDPYTNGFISDYVRMLGLVKDSYPLDFDYQDERDTAVFSMRDEIFDEVVQCDLTGHNLLFESADPSVVHASSEGGWFPAFVANGYGIESSPIPGTPFQQYLLDEGTLVSKALAGATAQALSYLPPMEELDPFARRPGWMQTVSLEHGRYVLSWSEELPGSDGATCDGMSTPSSTLVVPLFTTHSAIEVNVEAQYLESDQDLSSHPCWRRVRVVFYNTVAQNVTIAFTLRETPSVANPLPSVHWAAPQLETASVASPPSAVQPTAFFPTDDDLAFFIGICEDHTGARLRQHFSHHCEPICPEEFGDHCSGGQYCYWESNFVMDVEALMNGENAQFGGIAARSYNHRIQSLALNLVGTNVRDCERSSRPSVCYASGFLPYSLRLEGGSIRNHFGEPVSPPYSPANVEFARALATERYVANPMSSADTALLEGFWRRSFQGYPLSAHYRLRIVDVDELAWERLRDIQLIVEYSAWRNQH